MSAASARAIAELFRAHRESLAEPPGRQGWRFTAHRTDGTPSWPCSRLMGDAGPAHGGLTMLDFGLLGFTQPWLLLARTRPARPLAAAAGDAAGAAPDRVPAVPAAAGAGRAPSARRRARPGGCCCCAWCIAALLILALAGPVLNPAPRLGGSGPLLLVVDNGWAAAKHWDQRVAVARELLQQAEREGREVLLLETAPRPEGPGRAALSDDRPRGAGSAARLAAAALAGRPRRRARGAGADARPRAGKPRLAERRRAPAAQRTERTRSAWARPCGGSGPVQVRADPAADMPLVLRLGEPGAASWPREVVAVPAPTARTADIVAVGPDGRDRWRGCR